MNSYSCLKMKLLIGTCTYIGNAVSEWGLREKHLFLILKLMPYTLHPHCTHPCCMYGGWVLRKSGLQKVFLCKHQLFSALQAQQDQRFKVVAKITCPLDLYVGKSQVSRVYINLPTDPNHAWVECVYWWYSHCCCCWHLQKLTQVSWPLHSCHSWQLDGEQFAHPVQIHVNQFLRSQNNTSMVQYTTCYWIRTY